MAGGLPDYTRDIRPRYGGALVLSGSKQVTKNTHNVLAGVDGKGMIYGGTVWLDYTHTQANSEVRIMPDDQVLQSLSFYRMLEYGIDKPRSSVVTLNKYDSVNHVYSVGISYGITFEISLELAYNEQNGFTPTVHYRLVYTLI